MRLSNANTLDDDILNFNPRTHRGVRPFLIARHTSSFEFQSTHPSWGATYGNSGQLHRVELISIHAPIVGCDQGDSLIATLILIFQSTHPSWGATNFFCNSVVNFNISIHAPIVGCDS